MVDKKSDEKVSAAARALSKLGASDGGKARAAKLSAEERQEIARQAAAVRWGNPDLPRALCGSADRPLRLGDVEIPCYVLEDGRRVLVQRGLQMGIGMSTSGGTGGAHRMARFVESLGQKDIKIGDLAVRIRNPILFLPVGFAKPAYGYEATVLPDICRAVLKARQTGVLLKQQEHLARECEALVGALADVGIIALVDEATGYQDQRAHDALAKILERFIVKELQPYVRTFPPDFYKEIYRLRGWEYPPKHNRHNSNLGKLTNDLVYDRLAPGVRDELHRLTPRRPSGRLKDKLFQRLTPDFGHPKLREHLGGLVMAMKLSDSWDGFMNTVNRHMGKPLPVEDRKTGQRSLPLGKADGSSTDE